MQNNTQPSRHNPLINFMRQPKIYIKLPSGGAYWPKKSLDMPETGEFPVYSMTARDELMFKTPDALMNGQAIVDVIQSCMPNIKNAWDCPTIDLDTILIAIRLATYGEKMPFTHKVPVVGEDIDFDLDLRLLLDKQQENHWLEQVPISEDMIIFVKPLTYKHMTQTSLKSFETSRIMNIVNDEKISDEERIKLFNTSFSSLTKISIDLMAESIYKIITSTAEVTEPSYIKEFVANADKDIFEVVQNHLSKLKKDNELPDLNFTSTPEQVAAGAPETYSIPVNFNNSDFFG